MGELAHQCQFVAWLRRRIRFHPSAAGRRSSRFSEKRTCRCFAAETTRVQLELQAPRQQMEKENLELVELGPKQTAPISISTPG